MTAAFDHGGICSKIEETSFFHLSGDQKQTLSLKVFVQCNTLQMRLNVVRGNGTRESASTHS